MLSTNRPNHKGKGELTHPASPTARKTCKSVCKRAMSAAVLLYHGVFGRVLTTSFTGKQHEVGWKTSLVKWTALRSKGAVVSMLV